MSTSPLPAVPGDPAPLADVAGRKTALITGSNGRLGLALARKMADSGWRVLLHGRDPEKLGKARAKLGVGGPHAAFRADLADLDAVRQLADDVREATDRLDVIVHNAGVLLPRLKHTADGVEMTAAINALAPFALTNALRPLLEATAEGHGGARVVTVSSDAQSRRLRATDPAALADALRGPAGARYSPVKAYGRSKLLATTWTLELARRLDGTGVTANACHPGVVRTGIFWGLGGPNGLFASLFSFLYLPPSVGAESPLLLATAPAYATRTGRYVTRGHFRGPHEVDPPAPARSSATGAAVWEALGQLASGHGG